MGNISNESNISIPRTPGTPKSNKIEESLKSNAKKVFGPSEGHLSRNQGKTEPYYDKPKRVKDLPRREYGAIRDKHVPLDVNDPIIASVARTFSRAIEISNHEISETSRANIMIENSRERNRPGGKCTGTISSIRANAQRDLPKSLIELGAKIKNSGDKAQMPATLKQRTPEAQMPKTTAQMPTDPPDMSKTKAQMPVINHTVPL